jgi:ubiquitin-like-conjugating enzyme ATG3
MNSLKKTLYEGYKAAAEMVIPDLKNSNFLETGMLTKEEFALSCDKLIQTDPSWTWMKYGECLIKKRILCNKIQLEQDINVDTDINVYNLKNDTLKNELNNDNKELNISDEANDSDTESDDFLANFENSDLVAQDEATLKVDYTANKEHYYNVSITYDQYYRTPRIWFEGTDSFGHMLEQDDIYSDFMVEYIKVSLTLEKHPILNLNCISVHPCKHAFAMQKMFAFELEKKDVSEVKIEDYIVHFLKFASCVIPQLEFDKSQI